VLADPLFFTENKSKLHPPQSAQPLIKVFQPWPYENISSVNFIASVTVVTVTEKPTIFELVTDSGVVIGSKLLAGKSPRESLSFEMPLSCTFITTRGVCFGWPNRRPLWHEYCPRKYSHISDPLIEFLIKPCCRILDSPHHSYTYY
jgi:hypothetical protein